MRSKIKTGDAEYILKGITSESIDAVITDPPYGISFLGNTWDNAVPPVSLWSECFRVMKPGAFSFVMSSPRQDVLSAMIRNLEQAGFNIKFTSLYWAYSSGFPKATDLFKNFFKKGIKADNLKGAFPGFNPKPAVEVVLVAMKPIEKATLKEQALDNQKGCTWLDDCRIPAANGTGSRFPANLLVSDDILNDGRIFKSSGKYRKTLKKCFFTKFHGHEVETNYVGPQDTGSFSKYFDLDAWFEDQISNLPEDVRKTLPFLLASKPTPEEKNAGVKNIHPTVKPIKLMSYLVTMASRENDLVLDPFCGSGTTGIASLLLKRQFFGIELDPEHARIAQERIKYITKEPDRWASAPAAATMASAYC
jgi:site-specific DNA-methyltransferase (adenine-specific)